MFCWRKDWEVMKDTMSRSRRFNVLLPTLPACSTMSRPHPQLFCLCSCFLFRNHETCPHPLWNDTPLVTFSRAFSRYCLLSCPDHLLFSLVDMTHRPDFQSCTYEACGQPLLHDTPLVALRQPSVECLRSCPDHLFIYLVGMILCASIVLVCSRGTCAQPR